MALSLGHAGEMPASSRVGMSYLKLAQVSMLPKYSYVRTAKLDAICPLANPHNGWTCAVGRPESIQPLFVRLAPCRSGPWPAGVAGDAPAR